MTIRGYVDIVDIESVVGWVLDEQNPDEVVIVDIFVSDAYVGSTVANIEAHDLYESGLPTAARRFKFLYPNRLHYSDLTSVVACVHKNQKKIDGDFKQFRQYLSTKYNTPETLMPYCFCIEAKAEFDPLLDRYKVSAMGDIRVESDRFSDVRIRVENEIWSDIGLGLPTKGRARDFWFYPESTNLGFQFDAYVKKTDVELLVIELTYLDGGTLVAMPIAAIPVGNLARDSSALIPDSDMIERVIGPTKNAWLSYVVGGWTNAAQLDWMIKKYMGQNLSDITRILDWGCGCARNTRPIAQLGGELLEISGVDIDPVNIAWSKDHIGQASFEVSDLLPPLDFSDDTFDVIYGLSILTHLTELAQDLWLTELCRVLKPGGVAFLTFHGEAAAFSRGFCARDVENYKIRGIEDYILDRALTEVVDDSNYYRSTFHTTEYIKSRWAKYFDIIGIEGTTGGYQWFAACRKRI